MLKPLLIAILALAIVAAVVFVGGKYWGKEVADETAGWNSYSYDNLRFKYPQNWKVTEIFLEVQGIRKLDGLVVYPSKSAPMVREEFINIGGSLDKQRKNQCNLLDQDVFICNEVNGTAIFTYRMEARSDKVLGLEVLEAYQHLVESAQTSD